jgi:hypothetical protein
MQAIGLTSCHWTAALTSVDELPRLVSFQRDRIEILFDSALDFLRPRGFDTLFGRFAVEAFDEAVDNQAAILGLRAPALFRELRRPAALVAAWKPR